MQSYDDLAPRVGLPCENISQFLQLRRIGDGECVRSYETAFFYVFALSLCGRESSVLCGGRPFAIERICVATGDSIQRFEGHTRDVETIALCVSATEFLSGSRDSTIRLWSIDSGAQLRSFVGHRGRVLSISVCADGVHFICSINTINTIFSRSNNL